MPFPTNVGSAELLGNLTQLFTDAHRQAFGYDQDDPIELVNLRLRALAAAGRVRFADLVARVPAEPSSQPVVRSAYFGPAHGLLETQVLRRGDISGNVVGPLILEEPDTTVVVPPRWSVQRDSQGNLILEKR